MEKQNPNPELKQVTTNIKSDEAEVNSLHGTSPFQSSSKELAVKQVPSTPIEIEKEKKNPVLSTAFTLTNMCIGVSIFTFQTHCTSFGLVWFLVFICVAAVINFWTIVRFVTSASKSKSKTYGDLVKEHLGKIGGIILDVFIMVYSFFLMVNTIAVFYQVLGRFINITVCNGKYKTYDEFKEAIWAKAYLKYPLALGYILIVFPMCIMKDLSKISFVGFIGVAFVALSVIIVVIQCPKYYNFYKNHIYNPDDESTHVNYTHLERAFTVKLEFFKGIASLAFGFICHNAILPVYENFENNEKGMKKFKCAAIISTLLNCGLYAIAVICAFLTNPLTPEDIIVNRPSIDKGGYDILMTIAKFAVCTKLIFNIAPLHVTYRISFLSLFTDGKMTTRFNILHTTITLIVAGVVAVVYEKILNYISYIGGFITVFFGYLFPILCWIKSNKKGFGYWLNTVELIGAVILCAIGITGGIATIIDDVSGN